MPDPIVSRVKPKRTPEQIKTEGRSPNRRPRWRGEVRHRTTDVVKGAAIVAATEGKTPEEITELLGLSPSSIANFRQFDPEFRQKFEQAIEDAKASARGELAGILPLAVQGIRGTIEGKNENPLKYQACRDNVRGLGVWAEKQEQDTKLKGEIVLKVVYDNTPTGSGGPSKGTPQLPN